MKAIVIHGAEDLRVDDLPDPAPAPGEVIVQIEYGGICGSDLHYVKHGAAGTSVLREPMVLGHEAAGRIVALGATASKELLGARVAIHPGKPCARCEPCLGGMSNLCVSMNYFGSAAHLPHSHGVFAQYKAVPVGQIRLLPDYLSTRAAATAEPLAVAIHAVRQVSDIKNKTVLVNGAGPIGSLIVAAARAAGAGYIFVSDLEDASLAVAVRMGADSTVNVDRSEALPVDVDVVFEATGVPMTVAGCLTAARRRGTVVQVGMLPLGEIAAPLSSIVSKELTFRGAFRFIDEISDAVELLAGGLDVEPLLTHTFSLDQVPEAFRISTDRSEASKVLLDFSL